MKEIWKPIVLKDIRDIYEVSNLGRVRNKNTKQIKAQQANEQGYLRVGLLRNDCDMVRWKRVNRLVAIAFLVRPVKPGGPAHNQVNHLNGENDKNVVDNLEWTTRSKNQKHAFRLGLQSINGEKNPRNVYTDNDAKLVCELLEVNNGIIKNVLKQLPLKKGNIRAFVSNIKRRKIWTHISKNYNW